MCNLIFQDWAPISFSQGDTVFFSKQGGSGGIHPSKSQQTRNTDTIVQRRLIILLWWPRNFPTTKLSCLHVTNPDNNLVELLTYPAFNYLALLLSWNNTILELYHLGFQFSWLLTTLELYHLANWHLGNFLSWNFTTLQIYYLAIWHLGNFLPWNATILESYHLGKFVLESMTCNLESW